MDGARDIEPTLVVAEFTVDSPLAERMMAVT
jgi:hypothetical protein